MSVWFVYRNPSFLPTGKHVQTFPEGSVLEWFQNNWGQPGTLSEIKAQIYQTLGCDVDGFAEFQQSLHREDIPAPTSIGEMRRAIDFDWPRAGQIRVEEHAVQIRIDREDDQKAIYIFDQIFANNHPDRVAWLMRSSWQIPEQSGNRFEPEVRTRPVATPGRWDGALFGVQFTSGVHWLEEIIPAFRLEGVRLPQLSRYLLETNLADHACSSWEQHLITLGQVLANLEVPRNPIERSFHESILARPQEEINWLIYGDWLEEQNRSRAESTLLEKAFQFIGRNSWYYASRESVPNDTADAHWQIGEHMAQIIVSQSKATSWGPKVETWILFDDLWAGAHLDIAINLLRLTTRWDVLTDPDLPAGTLYA